MKRAAFLFMLVLLLTGCVEVEVHTKMNRDGSGVQTWHFQTTALLAGEVQKQIENDPFFQKGKKLAEEFKDGDFIMALEYPFRAINELVYKGRDIHFDRKGWFRVTCTYTEVWDRSFGDLSGSIARKGGNMIPLTLKVSVEMPGSITRTNAQETNGATAVWRFTLGELTGSRVLLVESAYWNWILIAPLSLVILAGAGGLTLSFLRKRARIAPVPCPSCGAKMPPESLFCSACGGRMHPDAVPGN